MKIYDLITDTTVAIDNAVKVKVYDEKGREDLMKSGIFLKDETSEIVRVIKKLLKDGRRFKVYPTTY